MAAVGERCAGLLEEAGLPPQQIFNVPAALPAWDRWSRISSSPSKRGSSAIRWSTSTSSPTGPRAAPTPPSTGSCSRSTAWLLADLAATPWDSRSLPWSRLPWRCCCRALQQHLYVTLYRTLVESLASEDASRLAAMQNAERNIEERLADLSAAYHHRRQETITAELLDIVAGFEAVNH
ncbi:MAG: F0F1 ATP synthase subunit gamma [Caldilineaceae bacterium]